MNRRILIVEDDAKTTELVRLYLENDGYQVMTAGNGRQAIDLARQRQFDLVVLDLMLPELDGLDVCRVLRAESDIPIVMLTAKTTEADKLLGLDLGADDYILKPFSPRELLARLRAVLRRTHSNRESPPARLQIGELSVDLVRHEVRMREELIYLTPKEFRVLEILIREPGKVFSRADLLEKAFGFAYEGLERTVDVHIMNLRRKIESDPKQPDYILTAYGVGYKLAEVQADAQP